MIGTPEEFTQIANDLIQRDFEMKHLGNQILLGQNIRKFITMLTKRQFKFMFCKFL